MQEKAWSTYLLWPCAVTVTEEAAHLGGFSKHTLPPGNPGKRPVCALDRNPSWPRMFDSPCPFSAKGLFSSWSQNDRYLGSSIPQGSSILKPGLRPRCGALFLWVSLCPGYEPGCQRLLEWGDGSDEHFKGISKSSMERGAWQLYMYVVIGFGKVEQ